jgi:Rieske Fe-S protein
MTETPATPSVNLTRRSVIAGAAAIGVSAALVACSDPTTQTPGGTDAGDGSSKTVSAKTVPVGSAVISGTVIVSQPTEGTFKAFSAICTHQQCIVARIEGSRITCTCHGSQFSTKDGSVITGPATAPLNPMNVSADGDTLTIS